jgi:hypothetical protein
VKVAVNATLLMKPQSGVTVMVEVLFVIAPRASVTDESLFVKLGFTTVVTVTGAPGHQ